ncbi:MAG: transcription termination/antitermination factor NusG [Dehalococcoidia bacterium]|nr:transcription termination/antitermination factor NusG [Dehalococcoidia bacterium]MSQ35368.1 transcription termination/antitermination factor NusG [Dehalococcoidia bacterium]
MTTQGQSPVQAQSETPPVFDKSKARWYIVHTYSGQEDRVKKNLEQRVSTMDVKDKIFETVIPTEEKVEIKEGQRKTIQKKMYAGYLIVHMVMDDESWYVVRNTPGVTGFISAEDEREKRPKPVPLEQVEVDRIMRQMTSEAPRARVGFEKGEMVRIKDGPFVDFIGSVDEVNDERGKVRVLVSFFGRETPVELDFLQLEKT